METSNINKMSMYFEVISLRMYVVNRRFMSRLMYRIMLLLIFAASFLYASQEAIDTASIPIKNMVVIIDPGHGGIDSGATSINGVEEKHINLDIAMKLRRLIEQAGGVALMIREDGKGLYTEGSKSGRKREDLKTRQQLIKESDADIVISIHLNSFPQSQYYGAQTFYKNGDERSKKLSECIQSEMLVIMDRGNNRAIKPRSDTYLFKGNNIPGALVECGFLSNPEEEKLLQQGHYQEKLAWCIFSGIIEYFENEAKLQQ